jgi:hypothetical protein
MREVRVPYSDDQANAHIDSCLYGLPYGVEYGSYEYVAKKLGVAEEKIKSLSLDDSKHMFVVTVDD